MWVIKKQITDIFIISGNIAMDKSSRDTLCFSNYLLYIKCLQFFRSCCYSLYIISSTIRFIQYIGGRVNFYRIICINLANDMQLWVIVDSRKPPIVGDPYWQSIFITQYTLAFFYCDWTFCGYKVWLFILYNNRPNKINIL